jgi:outer membrane biosynthesis protein TonB
VLAALFTIALATARPTPGPAPCPLERVRAVRFVDAELPEGAHPSNEFVRYAVDIGSDGRIRRVALTESSGDPAVDDAVRAALTQSVFAAASFRCVAVSSAFIQTFPLPPPAPDQPADQPSAAPAASATPVAAASPPAVGARCAAPFPTIKALRLSSYTRQAPGTAAVDVSLDAAAHVTHVQLVRSTGNKRTDYAAAITARLSTYKFLPQAGCAPSPTVYRLELTYR